MAKPIGILGGTFDPIHFAHLRIAWEMLERLKLDHVRLIPCHTPPHRQAPIASPADRLAMLEYATESTDAFVVDDREIKRGGPSYMVDTLRSLREDYPNEPLCLLLGMDAFAQLTSWHEWEALITLAHLVISARPTYQPPVDPKFDTLLAAHQVEQVQTLHEHPAGKLLFVEGITQLGISATQIRAQIACAHDAKFLSPEKVLKYIHEKQLYRGEHA